MKRSDTPAAETERPRLSPAAARVTVLLFCLFLAGFLIAFIVVPDRTVSEEENRTLQTLPAREWGNVKDGTFAEEMNDYIADQFPLRRDWVAMKAMSEIFLGKGANNGVLFGQNEQLGVYLFDVCAGESGFIEQTDGYSAYAVRRACEAVNALDAKLKENGIPFCFLLAPRTIDVAASAFTYPDDGSLKLQEDLYGALSEDVNAPRAIPLLREMYEDGQYVMYRTDHHWTTRGAYAAYRMILDSWGMGEEILPESAFTREEIPDFYGTTWSRCGLPSVGADILECWTAGDEDRYRVTDLDSKEELPGGLYNRSYLEGKDKYGMFLDGTHNRLLIMDRTSEGRETLLVAKDSFANCLIPFLVRHFDILALNLSGNGDETNISKYCETYGCGRVLIVFGLENVITSYRLAGVR